MIRVQQILPALTVAALLASPAYAGAVRFNPSLAFEAGATDNIEYAGANESSDVTLTFAAELPLERNWEGGSLALRYRPSYVTHGDADALDRDEHRLDLRTTKTLGRLTRFGAAAGWHKRQEQGGTRFDEAATFEDRDPFLTERSDRESAWASLSLGRVSAPRWRWNVDIGWGTTDHEAIDDLTVDPFDPTDPDSVEDRDEFGGSFEISRRVARRTSVGVELAHREYELEFSGDEQADLFGVTIKHEASRRLTMSAKLGAARQSYDDPARDETTEVQGSLSVSRTFRAVALGVKASHEPSAGGHLAGTSTNTRAAVTLGALGDRAWSWDTAVRFDRRDPTDPMLATREAFVLGVGAEHALTENLGLGLGLEWIDQSGSTDRSAARATAGLRWYPRGRAVRE